MHKVFVRTAIIMVLFAILLGPQPADARKARTGPEEYTFEREIRLAPGEHYALTYDDNRKEFVEIEPDRGYGALPDGAIKQVLRAPKWLREKFADRLADLYTDDIDVGEDAAPVLYDVNKDGQEDLVVGNAAGEYRCFLAPYFKEDDGFKPDEKQLKRLKPKYRALLPVAAAGRTIGIMAEDNGGLKIVSTETASAITGEEAYLQALVENLTRIEVSGKPIPVLHDVTGDGLDDLLIGASDGTISVYKNCGTKEKPWFVSNNPEVVKKYDFDVGYLSSPAIADINGDGVNDIVMGGKDWVSLGVYYGPEYDSTKTGWINIGYTLEQRATKGMSVTLADFDGNNEPDIAEGLADGSVHVSRLLDTTSDEPVEEWVFGEVDNVRVPSYATPAGGDFDRDGKIDLAVGSGADEEGRHRVYFFKNTGKAFKKVEGFFGDIEVGEYPRPAGFDVNNDGKTDLVVGNRAGDVRVFLAPNWEELEGGLGIAKQKAFASPTFGDLTGDGKAELLIGGIDGKVACYEQEDGRWVERNSWIFHPSRGVAEAPEYFKRTHPDRTLLRGMLDDEVIEKYVKILEDCPDNYFDEAVFTMSETQTEILRVMSRLDNADLIVENARCIYEVANKVAYADIVEKGDYTTIKYVDEKGVKREMPRDIYYMWVVHPIVEYEIPARVNGTYWRNDHEYYGTTREQWTRKEVSFDMYEHGADADFWRSFFLKNRRYGQNVFDVLAPAKNFKEAVYLIADWVAFAENKFGGWNEYGLQSNDHQPIIIYEKNYGSCGEQGMIGVAFGRTALIPTAPVGCMGEDHAWTEFWMDDNWHKWDVCQSTIQIDHPWMEQIEHNRHKTTITRRWPNGRTDNTTTLPTNPPGSNYNPGNAPGYSEVGKAHIYVKDETGEPVEGALVVIRSKASGMNRISIWDWTDPEGNVSFEIGNPPAGSVVADVITPLGITGSENLIVKENEEFTYTYTLPGRFRAARAPVLEKSVEVDKDYKLTVGVEVLEEEQRPRDFVTRRRDSTTVSELRKATGYYGTRWFSEPNEKHYGLHRTKLSAEEYKKFAEGGTLPHASRIVEGSTDYPFEPKSGDVIVFYNDNQHTHVRFKATVTAAIPHENPEIKIWTWPEHSSAGTGRKLAFDGEVSDNLHVAKLLVSFDGGANFTDISESRDKPWPGHFEWVWDTAAGRLDPPGEYKLVFRVEDANGAFAQTKERTITINPARTFKDQVIYQDNAASPLPECSWMLGPFTVAENERFIGVSGESVEEGFDMDLFVYYDKNGNRKLDGAGEELGKSTSPTAVENFVKNDPAPGVYWVYCQGWQVVERKSDGIDPLAGVRELPPGKFLALDMEDFEKKTRYALLDVSLSFGWKPAFIVDISPVGEVPPDKAIIKGSVAPGFKVAEGTFKIDKVVAGGPSVIFAEKAPFGPDGFEVRPEELLPGEYEVTVSAESTTGIKDEFSWKFTVVPAPKVKVERTIAKDYSKLTVEVEFLAEGEIELAYARIDEGVSVPLKPDAESRKAKCDIPLAEVEAGSHKLTVEFKYADCELDKEEFDFQFKRAAQAKLLKLIPSGNVYDHKSLVQAYYAEEIEKDVTDVRFILDGEDLTKKVIRYPDGIMYFPPEEYAKGEHTFSVEVTLSDGRIISETQTFTVLSIDEREKK